MGPWTRLLLIVVVCAPHCNKCAREGRTLTQNEFAQTVYINRDSIGKMHLCMGVIYGSITIITSGSCAREQLRGKVEGTTVRTPQNIFSADEEAISYPTVKLHYSDPIAKPGSNFTLAILNLAMPGIMVDPFSGVGNDSELYNSTIGIRAAAWITDYVILDGLIDSGTTGVVTSPDRKVVAMSLLEPKTCREKWSNVTKLEPPNNDVLLSSAVCAIKAKLPIYHKDDFEPVPPGYVCDDDYGAPFIYEGQVIGVLVRAFCDIGEENALAVFLTKPPLDDIDSAETTSAVTTTTRKFTGITDYPTSKPLPTPHSGGLTFHPNHHYASVVSTVILLLGQTLSSIN